MSTSLTTLIARTTLQVPGCPRAMVLDALQEAARELCRRSGAWRQEIALTTVAETLSYALTATATGAQVTAVKEVKDAETDSVWDRTWYEYDVDTGYLTFVDDPGADTLTVTALLEPSGSTVPDWMVTCHARLLEQGAAAIRGQDPRRPWSRQDWPVLQGQFREGVGRLRVSTDGKRVGQRTTALQGLRVL